MTKQEYDQCCGALLLLCTNNIITDAQYYKLSDKLLKKFKYPDEKDDGLVQIGDNCYSSADRANYRGEVGSLDEVKDLEPKDVVSISGNIYFWDGADWWIKIDGEWRKAK